MFSKSRTRCDAIVAQMVRFFFDWREIPLLVIRDRNARGQLWFEAIRLDCPYRKLIALKKREQHSRGNEFLGLRKHLSNRRVVNDPGFAEQST